MQKLPKPSQPRRLLHLHQVQRANLPTLRKQAQFCVRLRWRHCLPVLDNKTPPLWAQNSTTKPPFSPPRGWQIPPKAWSGKKQKKLRVVRCGQHAFFTHGVRILLETFETTLQEQVDLFAHRRSRSLRLCFVRQQTVRQVQRQRFRQGFGVDCFPKRVLQVRSKVDRR